MANLDKFKFKNKIFNFLFKSVPDRYFSSYKSVYITKTDYILLSFLLLLDPDPYHPRGSGSRSLP